MGTASRPATTKLLYAPPASAAHRWLSKGVASSAALESGTILPPACEIGDCTLTVPFTPAWEDAETTLSLSGKNVLAVIEMLPPCPWAACARIWLFCRIKKFGSMLTLPPPPLRRGPKH